TNVGSNKVTDALKHVLDVHAKLAATQRDLAQQQRLLADITQDQARLRANLKEMPQTANAYKRYLEKFDQQETEIEKLQTEIKRLQELEHQQKKDFEAYLADQTLE